MRTTILTTRFSLASARVVHGYWRWRFSGVLPLSAVTAGQGEQHRGDDSRSLCLSE